MTKSFKIQVDPNKLDVNQFDLFIKELENKHLGLFKDGKIIYDDRDENEVFILLNKYMLPKVF